VSLQLAAQRQSLARSLEMTVDEAISAAESILPGHAAPDGEIDARWQAIIAVSEFIEAEPEVVWSFARKWGAHPDDDLRMAISTCVLEHLLEYISMLSSREWRRLRERISSLRKRLVAARNSGSRMSQLAQLD
jgi:hypothetical protein